MKPAQIQSFSAEPICVVGEPYVYANRQKNIKERDDSEERYASKSLGARTGSKALLRATYAFLRRNKIAVGSQKWEELSKHSESKKLTLYRRRCAPTKAWEF